jgi:HTH-type transcriptional regulator / antitoxin HigA
MSAAQLEEIEAAWMPISGILHAPRTDADYRELVALVDAIVDRIGEDDAHPLASLLDVAGELIRGYEETRIPDLV